MEDLGVLFWIAAFWLFASFLSAQRKGRREKRRPPARPRSRPPGAPQQLPTQETTPTQREATQLERLLRELGAELGGLPDQTRVERGPMGRPAAAGLESDEEVEDRTVLERDVVTEERAPVVREERVVVDYDAEADRVVAARLEAAEARNRELTLADHRAFDRRIREREPTPRTRSRFDVGHIRRAIVWREILGPPVALRGEDSSPWR